MAEDRRHGPFTGAVILFGLTGALTHQTVPARAEEITAAAKEDKIGEYYSLSGLGGSGTGLFAYQGIIALPMGSYGESGPVFRAWGKTFAFEYKTDLIDPEVVLPPVKGVDISAQAYGIELEAGYQFAREDWRLALFIGGSYRYYDLSPDDPRSKLAGHHYDIKVAVDGQFELPGQWGVGFNGSYVTGVEEYWVQMRPHYRTQSYTEFGVDTAAFGGDDYNYARAGLYMAGLDLTQWGAEATYLSGEGGGQIDLDLNTLSAYGAIHVGVKF